MTTQMIERNDYRIARRSFEEHDYQASQNLLHQIDSLDESFLAFIVSTRRNRLALSDGGILFRRIVLFRNPETGRKTWGSLQITKNESGTYDFKAYSVNKHYAPKMFLFEKDDVPINDLVESILEQMYS